jgi:transposase-like protein
MAKDNHSAGYVDQIQEQMDGDVLRTMLRIMVQEVMEEEITRHLGAERHERTGGRRGQRNGYKPRSLGTRVGKLALEVPQARGVEPYSPTLFARYERNERALLTACAEMYFAGVSTRKVQRVLEQMGGLELSAATVSRVASDLDETLTAFRERRLDGQTWPYLMVDACYVKTRQHGNAVNRAVLVVAGVNGEGRREILTWRMGDAESEDTWSEVFRELRQRGVNGVEWVISDGHQGIRKAVAAQFDGASWQRCWTHFMRNALAKVGHKETAALAKDLVAARKLADKKTCLMEAERIAARYEKRFPRVAPQIREQFEETLAVHDLPSAHRRRVYTTNMIERVMLEIKRRTRVVGIFPNDASCDRLIGAQLLDRHEQWQCEQARYLNMDLLEEHLAQRGKEKSKKKRT